MCSGQNDYLATMEMLKEYWDHIYESRSLQEVSWYEPVPATSLSIIEKLHLPKDAAFIDIGGGDSFLTEALLERGFSNLSVLDISGKSLERAKKRIGVNAAKIKWIESNVLDFEPPQQYDVWHDRAVFHFLTVASEQEQYVQIARRSIKEERYLLMGTFADNGPGKCSGLPVQRYTEDTMGGLLQSSFKKVACMRQEHQTPFNTIQHFLFCSFKKQ